MPRNPSSPVQGSVSDSEFRRRRAAHANAAKTTPDYYITKLVESAPRLTPQQADRLRAILRSAPVAEVERGEPC
jgi:hypothetical protein